MAYKDTLRRYYRLAKPGIIYGNLITAAAGYLFAAQLHFQLSVVLGLLFGLAPVIGGACAFNNYLDRGIDKAMQRTKNRSLVTGEINAWPALTYAAGLTIFGLLCLLVSQNWLTVALAIVAFVDYVVLYGIGKRLSVHGTLIGCIAGAIPLVAGYTAATGRLSTTAWLLFGLMVAWQMAHFYGIALYRLKDYKAAKLPVMPVVYGATATRQQAIGYIVLFAGCAAGLLATHAVGWVVGSLLLVVAGLWFFTVVSSYRRLAVEAWGKQLFLVSLIVMLTMSSLLAINPLLA